MVTGTRSSLGQSAEDYLKAIYHLQEAGGAVSTSGLAEALGVSSAAATKAMRLLAERKLVHHKPYHGATLTDSGTKRALKVIRSHRLLELFLHQILGYRWDEVDDEAERLEHHVSDEFLDRVDRLLEYPEIDPHGDPIPSSEGELAACSVRSLADCEPQERVVIARVRDKNGAALRYLAEMGLRPGVSVEVLDKQPFNGPLTLGVAGETYAVGQELAGFVFVRVDEEQA